MMHDISMPIRFIYFDANSFYLELRVAKTT